MKTFSVKLQNAFSIGSAQENSLDQTMIWRVAISLSLFLGIYFRVLGINNISIGIDEYFVLKSINNIMKHGLPEFDTGGYYVRGPLYQYILTISYLLVKVDPEILFRIINIGLNFLALPAVFLLGKKIASKEVGYVSVILLCFSLWEIEFTRYIRWYVFFQTLFIWYALFLYNVIVEKQDRYLKWMYITSFISLFAYEQAIFLVLLNFIPFILRKDVVSIKPLLISFSLIVIAYFLYSIDFVRLGVSNYLPTDVPLEKYTHKKLLFPDLLFTTLNSYLFWIIAFVPLIGITGSYIYKLYVNQELQYETKIVFIIAALLSLLNLFGSIIAIFVLGGLVYWIKSSGLKHKSFRKLLVIGLINFSYWLAFMFFTSNWIHQFTDLNTFSLKKAVLVLFNYPDIYHKIVQPWVEALPAFAALAAVFIGFSIVFVLTNQLKGVIYNESGYRILLSMLLFSGLIYACVGTLFDITRYMFFLFPLIIVLLVGSIHNISAKLAKTKKSYLFISAIFVLIFVSFGEDYDFHHLFNLGGKEVNLRIGFDKHKEKHYFQRVDIKSPAEFVNKNIADGDVVVSTILEIDYYLNRMDYIYDHYTNTHFIGTSAERGTKELWSNANLIYKEKRLLSFLENSESTIWFIVDNDKRWSRDVYKEVTRRYSEFFVFQSYDQKIDVFKITPHS